MPNSSIPTNVKRTLNGMPGVHVVAAELVRWGLCQWSLCEIQHSRIFFRSLWHLTVSRFDHEFLTDLRN
jgi:hypothetical protein